MRPSKLTPVEIAARLADLVGWEAKNDALQKTFAFPTFMQAIKFVNALADKAERADHHPDIDIRFNKVKICLTTHSSGGITDNDFALAMQADNLI